MNLTNIGDKIVKIIGFILLFIAFILVLLRADNLIRNQAIDGCAQAYRYEQPINNGNANVSYPMTELYERCLEQKGITLK